MTEYYQFASNPEFHVWDLETYEHINSAERFKNNWIKPFLKPGVGVLDIGCGPGYNVKVLHDNNVKVLGIDLNEVLVNKAQLQKLPVIKMDALEAVDKFRDEYSIFIMSDFIEHVPLDVVVKILEKISKLKNAVIYIATPNLNSLMGFKFWFHMPSHINAMHPFVIRNMLQKMGYAIQNEWSEYGNLPGLGWKHKVRKKILELIFGTQAELFLGGANICFIAKTHDN